MNRTRTAVINLIFLILTLVVNGLGAAGVINGLSQKEISDKYITIITPSPSTFSIWSVIYTLLIISLIVMILKKKDEYYQKAIDEISLLYRLSCGFNIVWIVLFSYLQILLSSIFIFGFLITLSLLSIRLVKIHEKNRFLLPLTFGLYTGWLMIATVVNISASLVKLEWSGFGIPTEILAITTLIISILLVYLVQLSNKNAVFPLPIAWAFFGIYNFLTAPEGFDGEYKILPVVCLIGMVVLIGIGAIQLYKNKFGLLPANKWN